MKCFFLYFLETSLCIGYVGNIVKLCRYDFMPPVKAEFIRSIGVFVPPVGAVLGYLTIQDGKGEAK